jgi:hypothetical protein
LTTDSLSVQKAKPCLSMARIDRFEVIGVETLYVICTGILHGNSCRGNRNRMNQRWGPRMNCIEGKRSHCGRSKESRAMVIADSCCHPV